MGQSQKKRMIKILRQNYRKPRALSALPSILLPDAVGTMAPIGKAPDFLNYTANRKIVIDRLVKFASEIFFKYKS